MPILMYGNNMFESCINLNSFSSSLSNLTEGNSMFKSCYALTSFNVDLPNLENGEDAFRFCRNLTTFNSSLKKLTSADYMFGSCGNLTSFTSDLSSLSTCGPMFFSCGLTSFNVDMPSLNTCNSMFCYCENLTSFTSDLSSLTSAYMMFYDCEKLETFKSNLRSLTNGNGMFSNCILNANSVNNIALTINRVTNNPRLDLGVNYQITSNSQVKKDIGLIKHKGWDVYTNQSNATTTYTLPKYAGCTNKSSIAAKDSNYKTNDIVNGVWVEHLPDLTDANSLFSSCKELKTFNSDISKLGGGAFMFYNSGLESFTSDLTSLKQGSGMFNSTKLTSFNIKMPNLTSGSNFFAHCYNLKTFSSNLNNMAVGLAMFNNATALTTFEADLPSLTNGNKMFYACKLNTASVQRIANKIKNVTGLTNTGQYDTIYKQIDIGIGNSTPNTQEKAAFNTIASRGWTVLVNGSAYSPTSVSSIMTLDEDGNEVETPIPFYAKPVPSDEDHASYIDNDGNYYNILGA